MVIYTAERMAGQVFAGLLSEQGKSEQGKSGQGKSGSVKLGPLMFGLGVRAA